MFNLFKKKESGIKIIDKIWMKEAAKLNAFAAEYQKRPDTAWIFWFDETFRRAESLLGSQSTPESSLLTAREAGAAPLGKKHIIFVEHYPLQEKEITLYEKLHLREVQVWSALDEPLFKHFGGEKIIGMMQQLGMKDDSSIEHNMISGAIRNAQEKIAKKVTIDQGSRSQEEWLQKNL